MDDSACNTQLISHILLPFIYKECSFTPIPVGKQEVIRTKQQLFNINISYYALFVTHNLSLCHRCL